MASQSKYSHAESMRANLGRDGNGDVSRRRAGAAESGRIAHADPTHEGDVVTSAGNGVY